MEKEIVEMLCKNLKWYERAIVKIFSKTFIKVFNEFRETIVNIVFKR